MRTVLRYSATALVWGLLTTAVLAFLFLAIGPRVFGYQTYTMLTGSMAPLINSGDVVVSVPTDVEDVAVGDIITYHIPIDDHRVETHRVVEVIEKPDGSTAVRTKGDANESVDPWTAVLEGDQVDRHALTLPYLGTAIRTFQQPVLMKVLLYGAPTVLVAGMLMAIWRKNPEETDDGSTQAARKANVSAA
ncbi:signal peptidase I [Arthrobacter monumenti]